MKYFECAACGAPLYSAAKSDDLISDQCPVCGESVEPTAELAEPDGYRSIATAGAQS